VNRNTLIGIAIEKKCRREKINFDNLLMHRSYVTFSFAVTPFLYAIADLTLIL